ncbi:FAD-dependent monooxygenase [Geodermatophilus maliterrae]|uniref:FAD-dependent monooxygenase n=1 Tax=Geodermatophilus maliterrae TaxID=3162531 RepID=A0ABV3XK01_9ACTN
MAGRSTATVVGGGIAGLAAAASLVRAGWRVTVLERAAAFGEVGAGLAVTRNGMAALDALGIGDRVRSAGQETFAAGTQDRHGRWLLRLPDPRQDAQSSNRAWGVHRQRLHAALLAAAEDVDLVTGASVTRVRPGRPGGEPAVVTWGDGSVEHTRTADLLVAADGIGSTVRAQLFPGARVRYSGRTSWRAVVEHPGTTDAGFVALWGPRAEFGAVPISDREVYWYGYVRAPAGTRFDDEPAAAAEHFSGWAPRVRALVAATPPDRLMRHDVSHLPGGLPSYVRGRTVVIGDAAHAMLPTMGQGANTSLEDGVCVGRMVAVPVAAGVPVEVALGDFDRARRPRCTQIARRSLLTARLGAHVGPGWRQAARNAVLRLVPAGPATEAGTGVLRWAPPERA